MAYIQIQNNYLLVTGFNIQGTYKLLVYIYNRLQTGLWKFRADSHSPHLEQRTAEQSGDWLHLGYKFLSGGNLQLGTIQELVLCTWGGWICTQGTLTTLCRVIFQILRGADYSSTSSGNYW